MNVKKKLKNLWDLYRAFAIVGVTTFGGGYAMLPGLQREIVEKHGWTTGEELTDYYAVGQCTPGAIAVNISTFIGCKLEGIPGAVCASLGMITPSLIIITIISMFLNNIAGYAVVEHALSGIRVAVCVLIFQSVFKLARTSVRDVIGVVIFLIALVAAMFTSASPVWIVLAAGTAGFIFEPFSKKMLKDKEEEMEEEETEKGHKGKMV